MIGCLFAGLAYLLVALAIGGFGTGWLMRLLPPIVVGPVIMVIGLALRRAPGSPFRKSLIAVCLTCLWFYGKFMSGLFT